MLANAARRMNAEPVLHADVIAALVLSAEEWAVRSVERLRMLDDQQQAERDPSRPDLGTVLATYAT